MQGGYLFDDDIYFVANTDVHVTTLHVGDWIKAALQQAGTNQFRALSMLSFAANYYFTGLDPFWPKLTNLLIHLLNGLMLFLLTRELLGLWSIARKEPTRRPPNADLVAALLAGAWLLLPINFTAVAYVAQRMESLANLFVLLGLFLYLRFRQREYTGDGGGIKMAASLIASMAAGLSAKESAALLPLYTACVELTITLMRDANGKLSRPALWTHVLLLLLPLIAGVAWVSTWAFRSTATFRTFSIGERLLSEPRALVSYIDWSLLPNINVLTFYHDDFVVSHGLLDPPTTLWSILALLLLLGIALWQHNRRPLFCLGVLWFFAGHAMTGTVIPLELVFEHRNYFPSVGLLLVVASLLAFEPGLSMPVIKGAIATAFVALCTFTTFLRAEEWSNPLRLAYSEALKRPESARAQYDLARLLIIAAGKNEQSPLIDKSVAILKRSANRDDSGIAPLQALIYLNGRAHRAIDPRWWQAIVEKLQQRAPTQTDIGSVIFLSHCQARHECAEQKQELFDAFVAALTSSGGNVNLMSAYADFALTQLSDPELAVRMSREVVAIKPEVPTYRSNLVKMLIQTGQFEAAQTEIDELGKWNRGGSLDSTITSLNALLAQAKRESESPAKDPPRMSAKPQPG